MFSRNALIWYLAHLLLLMLGLIVYGAPSVAWFAEPLKSGVASSLVATGVCGAVLYLYTHINERRENIFQAVSEAGLAGVFRARSVSIKAEYSSRIDSSRSIDVIGYGLSHFRQDYGPKFAEMASTKKVRILIANPDFPSKANNYCAQRDREENNSAGTIAKDVLQFLTDTQIVRSSHPQTFRVRKMKMLPSINIFRMDEDILWGPYLAGEQSRNTPTILVKRSGYLGQSLTDHFERIWTSDELSEDV